MNRRTIPAAISATALVVAGGLWLRSAPELLSAARCTGARNCRACHDCSQCEYCRVQGGMCGVCGSGHDAPPVRASQIPLRIDRHGRAIGPNVSNIPGEYPGDFERYLPLPTQTVPVVVPTPKPPSTCHGGLICSTCPSGQHGTTSCKGCRYCSDVSRVCAHCPPIKRHAWAQFVGPPAPYR